MCYAAVLFASYYVSLLQLGVGRVRGNPIGGLINGSCSQYFSKNLKFHHKRERLSDPLIISFPTLCTTTSQRYRSEEAWEVKRIPKNLKI